MTSGIVVASFREVNSIQAVSFRGDKKIAKETPQVVVSALNALLSLASGRERMQTINALNLKNLSLIPTVSLKATKEKAENNLHLGSSTRNSSVNPHLIKLQSNAALPKEDPSFHNNPSEIALTQALSNRLERRYDDLNKSLGGDKSYIQSGGEAVAFAALSTVSTLASGVQSAVSMVAGLLLGSGDVGAEPAAREAPVAAPETLEILTTVDTTIGISTMLGRKQEELKTHVPEAFEELLHLNQAYEMFNLYRDLKDGHVQSITIKTQGGHEKELFLREFYQLAKTTHVIAKTFFTNEATTFTTQLKDSIEAFKEARRKEVNEKTDPVVRKTFNFATDERLAYLETVEKMCEVFDKRFNDRNAKIMPLINAWDADNR